MQSNALVASSLYQSARRSPKPPVSPKRNFINSPPSPLVRNILPKQHAAMLRRGNGLKTALQLQRQPLISARAKPTTSPHHIVRSSSTGTPSHSHDIAVLGGGITGLATAYFLTQQLPRAKITVYEAGDRIGGWLSSKRVEVEGGNVLFEAGPRTLRPAQNGVLAIRLIQELGLENDTIFTQTTSPAAINRYLYYPDRLVRMPHPTFGFWENFQNIWAEPVFDTALWSAVREPWKEVRDVSVKDESVAELFGRRLSKTMVDRILSGVIHGIYAGDVYNLSAKSLFPKQFRDEVVHGSVLRGAISRMRDGMEVPKAEADFLQEMKGFNWDKSLNMTLRDTSVFTFKDGLGMLVDRLARKLWEAGNVDIRTTSPVKSLALADDKTGMDVTTFNSAEPVRHDTVISALSPAHLNALAPADATLAPEVPSVTVMTVNLYFKQPDMHPPGFGYLIPLATPFEQNPERALGVVFDTAYSPSMKDRDTSQWAIDDMEELTRQHAAGRKINVNDFAWYNFPNAPLVQDEVAQRGTKLTVMLGGHFWAGWPAFPDEQQGLEMARAVLSRHLGIHQEPEAWAVNLQKDCIPQYTVGHEARLKQAHGTLARRYQGKLRVAGNWISGVGVNDCLRSAWDVVKGVREGKDGTGLEGVGSEEYVKMLPPHIARREKA